MVKIQDPNSLIQAFRHLLCEEREKRKLSQSELAKKSGLSRQCIALFEGGQRVPTFFSLFSLARGLDMPVTRFVSLFMNKLEFYEQQDQKLLVADSKKAKWRL